MMLRSMVIICLVLAAGCSSDPDKPGTISTSTPKVTSASPTPTETPVESQVEAAVRAYYAELTVAAQSNDSGQLSKMILKGCPCYRSVRVINGNRRRGETTPEANFALVTVKIHDVHAGSALAETRTRDSAYDVLDQSGKVIDRVDAARTHLDLSLVRKPSGAWVLANAFDLEPSG